MKKKKEQKIPRVEKVVDALDLPRELVLGMPRFVVLGDREATVENYKGIIEYDESRVLLNTSMGLFSLTGEGLNIKTITDDDITIEGRILGFEIIPPPG